ncbi:MAG: zinc-dependent alcohol dehydrogenase family protein [Bdellovibrionota bacterium]
MRAMIVKAHALIESSPLRLRDLPVPTPREKEVLVRVSVCGICRTDLHVIEGELPNGTLPIIPGHQIVGTVEALGPGCSRLKLGERVGIAWLGHTCGACEFCSSGKENLCSASRYTGYQLQGGYAELAVAEEDYAYLLPESFSDEQAAPLLCAGIIGYRALNRSQLPRGGKLGLFGFGSSAHITLQVALSRGAEVVVVTRDVAHQELARSLGASWAGDSAESLSGTLDSAIVFAPVGTIVPQALRALKKGGTVAIAGIYLSPIPEMDYEECLFHEKQLLSVEANTRRDGEALLEEAATIPIRPQVQVFPLEDANRALQLLKADGISGTGVLRIG